MPVTQAPIDLDILTDKQRSASETLLTQLRDLERTSFPNERQPIIKQIIQSGGALKTLVTKLEAQLVSFDQYLQKHGTTDTDDDLWILNLSRFTVMQSILSRAAEVV